MTCPSCSTAIRSSNINIHTDVGQCSACGFVFRVSEQLDGGSAEEGCWSGGALGGIYGT